MKQNSIIFYVKHSTAKVWTVMSNVVQM